MQPHYDYLIVGAGITSAVFAHEAKEAGKSCLVIDRRSHVAGNIYTEEVEGINVHKYGAHIFHTSLRPVWEYVNRFAELNNFAERTRPWKARVLLLDGPAGRSQIPKGALSAG